MQSTKLWRKWTCRCGFCCYDAQAFVIHRRWCRQRRQQGKFRYDRLAAWMLIAAVALISSYFIFRVAVIPLLSFLFGNIIKAVLS